MEHSLGCLRLGRINTLRPRRNEEHFADDIFKRIFVNENVWISIEISLKFVPKGPVNNILALVQIMAWRRSGDKPLTEPMMVSLPTPICVTRPQWVNGMASQFIIVNGSNAKWKSFHLDSLWSKEAKWRHWSTSTLVQVSEPLPESMLIYRQ